MENNIILIGTVHNDPRSKQRLEKLLNYTNPEILTVEVSDRKLKFIKSAKEELRSYFKQRGLNPKLIEKYISIHIYPLYEWFVSKEYAKKQYITIHKVELWNKRIEEQNRYNVESLKNPYLTDNALEQITGQYEANIKNPEWLKSFDRESYTIESLKKIFYTPECKACVGERDVYIAERISNIIQQNPGKKIVHVGGALHTIKSEGPSRPTLHMLLPPNKVYFLNDADYLGV